MTLTLAIFSLVAVSVEEAVVGLTKKLVCAQVNVFSSEAFANLGQGEWFRKREAVLLWMLLLLQGLMVLKALCYHDSLFSDEFFLVNIKIVASDEARNSQWAAGYRYSKTVNNRGGGS